MKNSAESTLLAIVITYSIGEVISMFMADPFLSGLYIVGTTVIVCNFLFNKNDTLNAVISSVCVWSLLYINSSDVTMDVTSFRDVIDAVYTVCINWAIYIVARPLFIALEEVRLKFSETC
jgi:ABC-type siderophore export system fused ATPase/permease subunit